MFTLRIEIGNDDVQTPNNIARLLRTVARQVENGRITGKVMDANGNSVGAYTMTGIPDDDHLDR